MSTTRARMNFVQLTQGIYGALESIDSNTLYFCTDTNRIYLGTNLMSRPAQVVSELPNSGQIQKAVYINTTDKCVYYFDGTEFQKVGGSDAALVDVSISGKKITTTTAGGTSSAKAIGGLFDNITYSNGVLSLSVTNDDGTSNSTSSYDLNIPVEQYLSGVSRKVVSSEDISGSDSSVYSGCVANDIGILFTMIDGSKMFVKLTDLIDTYTSDSTNTDVVKVNISGYGVSATLNFDTNHFETDSVTGALKIKASAVNSLSAVSGATENNVMLFNSSGNAKDGGKKVGSSTLAVSPDADTLATEAAVASAIEDAVSWTIITA